MRILSRLNISVLIKTVSYTHLDVCFDNWIKQDDWIKIIHNIEVDLINYSKVEQDFLKTFIDWIKEALQHTSVIVVEGNL